MKPRAFHPNQGGQLVYPIFRSWVKDAYHGVDKLDTVVLGRVVAGSDHDANRLAIELARAEGGQETDTVDDRVE